MTPLKDRRYCMNIDSAKQDYGLEDLVPRQVWFTLREACDVKNLNYKTSCNKVHLQPGKGKPDGKIGGKKVWSRLTIIDWVGKTDENIEEEYA